MSALTARLLSPRALADALGVSESSLKRWIDAGRIRATRTGGGHRRVTLPDALAFIRDSATPVLHPELLGLSGVTAKAVSKAKEHVDDRSLYRALVAGDSRAISHWISSHSESSTMTELFDGPIRDAMHAIGELWQHDPDGVFIEHRATDLCVQALAALRTHIDPPDDAPIALGCAPEDDPYIMPSTMAALVLGAEGYRTVNLGPDTPTAALHRAIAAHRPTIVWVSISAPLGMPQAAEIAAFVRSLPSDITPVVGGRQRYTIAEVDRSIPMAGSMADLAALARRLRPS